MTTRRNVLASAAAIALIPAAVTASTSPMPRFCASAPSLTAASPRAICYGRASGLRLMAAPNAAPSALSARLSPTRPRPPQTA
jgi:hypothetical protein